ncbi:class I SAM-dependent methyltransferase [Ramlibacter humi]|uniref:class I SAM-dependent methyltransferase n=1 Tax=Ramlibacter humi TaxID=2530451 RepID=UPI001430758F|nr:class I SAM-dependent methyltransferase [Ramlibacter humi]
MTDPDCAQMHGPQADRWMEHWLPAMRAAAAGTPVLELGCDTGGDTAWLLAQGFEVIGTDIAEDALRRCSVAAPRAALLLHDLRQPMPFADASFGVVVASLCLHYFDWHTTVAAVAEIRRCLRPGGLLLCRVNSTNDVDHGAMQGTEVEPHYFRQDAHYADFKRFFDAADLDRLFTPAAWTEVNREERQVLRYAKPKMAWEQVLRRT